jgi:glutamate-1-semialdehyde 2,1-aminomutase
MGDVGQKMSGPEASAQRPFIDEVTLQGLIKQEQALYRSRHPKSFELFSKGAQQLSGVPMTWMRKWSGGFPLYLSEARGCKITDVDGNKYTDFCLGDTGAMTGHSPDAVVAAVQQRLGVKGGVTTMMPTEDAAAVSANLCKRFGPNFLWSFTLSATDANRAAIRIARYLTKRPKILVVSWCYHGSVDEAIAIRDPKSGKVVARPGNVGPPVELDKTTRVVEFNDLAAMELELSHRCCSWRIILCPRLSRAHAAGM